MFWKSRRSSEEGLSVTFLVRPDETVIVNVVLPRLCDTAHEIKIAARLANMVLILGDKDNTLIPVMLDGIRRACPPEMARYVEKAVSQLATSQDSLVVSPTKVFPTRRGP